MEKQIENDDAFIAYWEKHRVQKKRLLYQLMVGLPIGLLFGLPIVLSVLMRGWYKRMPYVSGTQFNIILIAVLSIVVFYAIFRMRFKWEQQEERYRALVDRNRHSPQLEQSQ